MNEARNTQQEHAVASAAGASAERFAWRMLETHSPVTLLMDLARPGGPGSRRLLLDEGLPDGDWLPDHA